MKRILLIVGGGIAAYKACELIRLARKAGIGVRCVLTQGGAHVSVEALGDASTAQTGVLALRRRGRHVQVGLLLGAHSRPALPMDRVIAWELELYGSHGMAAHEYPAMLAAIADGRLLPDQLVGATVGLVGAADALAALGDEGAPRARMTVVVP